MLAKNLSEGSLEESLLLMGAVLRRVRQIPLGHFQGGGVL